VCWATFWAVLNRFTWSPWLYVNESRKNHLKKTCEPYFPQLNKRLHTRVAIQSFSRHRMRCPSNLPDLCFLPFRSKLTGITDFLVFNQKKREKEPFLCRALGGRSYKTVPTSCRLVSIERKVRKNCMHVDNKIKSCKLAKWNLYFCQTGPKDCFIIGPNLYKAFFLISNGRF
jgi:hypothetical protein